MKGPVLIVAVVAWLILAMFGWLLRDGLGPDAVESQGWEALERFFWSFYLGPIGLLLAVVFLISCRGDRRQSDGPTDNDGMT